jgi:hypothetical protein
VVRPVTRDLGAACAIGTAKVFERLDRGLLDRLGRANAIDWGRCSLDGVSFPATKGARRPAGTRPTAAGRAASAT